MEKRENSCPLEGKLSVVFSQKEGSEYEKNP